MVSRMAAVASSPLELHDATVPAPMKVTGGAGVALAWRGGRALTGCCGAWDSRHLVNTPPASRIAAAAWANAWRRDIRAAYLTGQSPWSTDPDRTSSGRSPKKQNRPGGSPTQPVSRFAPLGVWASRTTSHPEDHSI